MIHKHVMASVQELVHPRPYVKVRYHNTVHQLRPGRVGKLESYVRQISSVPPYENRAKIWVIFIL